MAKSTLVLIPLFGVHYVIFLGLPDEDVEPEAEVIKLYFEMFFNSFQVLQASTDYIAFIDLIFVNLEIEM